MPGTIISPSLVSAATRRAAALQAGRFGKALLPLFVGSGNVVPTLPNDAGMLNVPLANRHRIVVPDGPVQVIRTPADTVNEPPAAGQRLANERLYEFVALQAPDVAVLEGAARW